MEVVSADYAQLARLSLAVMKYIADVLLVDSRGCHN